MGSSRSFGRIGRTSRGTGLVEAIRRLEQPPPRFAAVFAVVLIVAVGRTLLELMLAAQPRQHPPAALLNNAAFYLCIVYLHAAAASWLSRRPLSLGLGPLSAGVGLGLLPPLLDLALSGLGKGYYFYVARPSSWRFSLVNPGAYSLGEALTLWLAILAFTGYVALVTRSVLRSLGAALCAYGIIAALAVLPVWLVDLAFEPLLPALGAVVPDAARVSGFRSMLSTWLLAALAGTAYLSCRRELSKRLLVRSVHAGPFVALCFLGAALSALESTGPAAGRLGVTLLSALGIYLLCVVALVQNDAHDALEDAGQHGFCTRDDSAFFSVLGGLVVSAALLWSEYWGAPLTLFYLLAVAYSVEPCRAKRWFPLNYAIEAGWGLCAFLSGAYAIGRHARPLSPELAVGALLVFVSWFSFNGFKDFKDIRGDLRAHNATVYGIAHRRGIALSRVHAALRIGLGLALPLPAALMYAADLVSLQTAMIAVASGLPIVAVLGLGPRRRTVQLFLVTVTVHVLALALILQTSGSAGPPLMMESALR